MNLLDALGATLPSLDSDYWKCAGCGALNSQQTNGDTCQWCDKKVESE